MENNNTEIIKNKNTEIIKNNNTEIAKIKNIGKAKKNNTEKFKIQKLKWTSDKKIKNITIYILGFILPVLVLTLVYCVNNLVPFGNKCMNGCDYLSQYVIFFMELMRKLKSGDSLFYTWHAGMGTNFWALIGYYLASPVNLILIFFKEKDIVLATNIILMIKVGFTGLFMTMYLRSKSDKYYSVLFSLAYTFSMYFSIMHDNMMWMDAVALFPLILLGFEKMMKKGNPALYCFSLALAIITNYYMGYYICCFLVFYFIYYYICECKKEGKKEFAKIFGKFAGFSFLSGMMAMFIILPELLALNTSYAVAHPMPKLTRTYDFYKNFLGLMYGGHLRQPVYCTIGVLVLGILFLLNKNIDIKIRIGRFAIAAFVILSAWNKKLDYVWNAFHRVHAATGSRYAFIFVFLLVTMAYLELTNIDKTTKISLLFASVIMILLNLMVENYYGNAMIFAEKLYINMGFTMTCLILVYLIINSEQRRQRKIIFVYSLLIGIEITYAICNHFSSVIPEKNLFSDRHDYIVGSETDDAKDNMDYTEKNTEDNTENSMYRLTSTKCTEPEKNIGLENNLGAVNIFSSIVYNGNWEIWKKISEYGNINSIVYNGEDDLINTIFSIKYIEDDDNIKINDNALPVGYYVGKHPEKLFKGDTKTEIEESFVSTALGKKYLTSSAKEIYGTLVENSMTYEYFNSTDIKGNITLDKSGYVFFSIPYDKGWTAYVDGEKVNIKNVDDAYIYISLTSGKHTIELKYVPEGFIAGTIISLISLAGLIICLVIVTRGKRNKNENNKAINIIYNENI